MAKNDKTTDVGKCKVIYRPGGRAGEYSPLAVNLYTGCRHGCLYCYVPRCIRTDKAKFHSDVRPRRDIIENITHDSGILSAAKTTEPVLMCFTCDPYTPEVQTDPYNMTTHLAIEILSCAGVNFQILTKAGMRAARDFELYKKAPAALQGKTNAGAIDRFATTLTYFTAAKSLLVEPFAAVPAERIASLKLAKEYGIETWVSLEPALNEGEIHLAITASAPWTDFYKIGKVTDYKSEITDWPGFIERVTKHLDALGKKYMLKNDLKQYKKSDAD